MSKINISFNNKNYNIDETSMNNSVTELKSHLQTVMNGSGSVVRLCGVSYNVDYTKLSNNISDFVTRLQTIAGNGKKVIINGVEYSIDSDKLQDAVSELETVLGNLHNPDDVVDIVIILDESILDHSVLG